MGTRAFGADAWLTLNNKPLSFRRGDENLDAGAQEYPANMFRITPEAPDDLEIVIDGEMLETERYGRWSWKPRGYAGLYTVEVRAASGVVKTARVRVVPSKLSYERYEQMLSDISQIAIDLLLQLNSPATEKAAPQSWTKPSSALREYALVKKMLHDLEPVIEQIRRSPHRTLTESGETRLIHEVAHFAQNSLPIPGPTINLPSHTPAAQRLPHLPQHWSVTYANLTYDVYENQLLKHFRGRQLLVRLESIQERATKEIERRELVRTLKRQNGWKDDETSQIEALQEVVEHCQDMARRCIVWGSQTYLTTVRFPALANRPTQILQKHPAYSRFYRVYLRFQQELRLTLNAERYLTELSLRKISELYETWSVFQMTKIIQSLLVQAGYQVISSNGFFEIKDDQFHFEVNRNAHIELTRDDVKVFIRYEPLYPQEKTIGRGIVSVARLQRTPDMSVEFWRNDQPKSVVVFDAKYRSELYQGGQIYLEEDLSKMSDYLQVIRWKTENPRQRPRSVVTSAYILYPGDILEHDSEAPERGALPLLPKQPELRSTAGAVYDLLQNTNLL